MAPPPAVVEIDFLGLGPPSTARSRDQHQHQNPVMIARRGGGGGGGGGSSIREIQKAVSRMDPDVLRSLITTAPESRMPQRKRSNSNIIKHNDGERKTSPVAAPIQPPNAFTSRSPIHSGSDTPAPAPALHPHHLPAPPPPHLAPLTIFYDGAVSVFDVPPQVADLVIKTAETGVSLASAAAVSSERAIAETLVADAPLSGLPLARKKSLRRFLEKRQLRHANNE